MTVASPPSRIQAHSAAVSQRSRTDRLRRGRRNTNATMLSAQISWGDTALPQPGVVVVLNDGGKPLLTRVDEQRDAQARKDDKRQDGYRGDPWAAAQRAASLLMGANRHVAQDEDGKAAAPDYVQPTQDLQAPAQHAHVAQHMGKDQQAAEKKCATQHQDGDEMGAQILSGQQRDGDQVAQEKRRIIGRYEGRHFADRHAGDRDRNDERQAQHAHQTEGDAPLQPGRNCVRQENGGSCQRHRNKPARSPSLRRSIGKTRCIARSSWIAFATSFRSPRRAPVLFCGQWQICIPNKQKAARLFVNRRQCVMHATLNRYLGR